ncbi:MAG: glutathione S-transferase [Acidovorax sp.]|uniref:glutathione S-transferase family protein n=1 Tax=Diaphorobacter TaxID=238749 RepID=UPI000DB468FB|nr:glutathione S-transferase family protein [Diaphorobacter sp.]PZU42380.1 MAG: glutathione S-transferase [Acidovorax sp.]
MLHPHHCISARSFRPLWMLEELQLPYQLHMLPFPPRALARSFLELNPLGTVPLLTQGDVRMTESAAMCQYLAATHPDAGLDVPPTDPAYGAYLNWLHMSDATLTFPQTLVLRYGQLEPAERQQPQVVEDYTRWFLARLRAVESATAHSDWLCAGRFTAADVAVGYALLLAQHLGLHTQWGSATRAYWERLQQRPAYQRALAVQHQAALDQGVSPQPSPDIRP